MELSFLISLPHAGLRVPDELKGNVVISENEIMREADLEAMEIYAPLLEKAKHCVLSDVARVFIDVNRNPEDKTTDGAIKKETSYKDTIYVEQPDNLIMKTLISKYHMPYHSYIQEYHSQVSLGLDCHTMAEIGPPNAPDPFKRRPFVCLGNGNGTSPIELTEFLAESFKKSTTLPVAINFPYGGGYIVEKHAKHLPWIQIEFSRGYGISAKKKSSILMQAIELFREKVYKEKVA